MTLNDITATASQLAKAGAKQLKNTGKIAALKINNAEAMSEINKLYAQIGERYYKQHGLAPEAGFETMCDKVTDLFAAINENNDAITEVKIDGVIDEVVFEPED